MGPIQANGITIAIAALLGGVMVMATLFFIFDSPPEQQMGAVSESPVEPGAALPEEGEAYTLFVRNVPAPFLDPGTGTVLGYIFLDVAFEVAGEDARARAEENLDLVSASFSLALAANGAGKADAPGVPDFEGMAALFQTEADKALGRGAVRRVTVSRTGAKEGS